VRLPEQLRQLAIRGAIAASSGSAPSRIRAAASPSNRSPEKSAGLRMAWRQAWTPSRIPPAETSAALRLSTRKTCRFRSCQARRRRHSRWQPALEAHPDILDGSGPAKEDRSMGEVERRQARNGEPEVHRAQAPAIPRSHDGAPDRTRVVRWAPFASSATPTEPRPRAASAWSRAAPHGCADLVARTAAGVRAAEGGAP